MVIANKGTGNEYELTSRSNFEVSSNTASDVYHSLSLNAAILHIIKTERANVICRLSTACLSTIKEKLAGYNIDERFGDNVEVLKSVLFRERINLCYYDNVLLNISKAFNSNQTTFELCSENNFRVYDEIVHAIKKHVDAKHLAQ
jgi:hypothetical protein